MSEPIWCDFYVKLPSSWGAISNDRGVFCVEDAWPQIVKNVAWALINGDTDADVRNDGSTIWHVNGEGNYGLYDDDFQEARGRCQQHRIPYLATDDSKYEFDGSIEIYDGQEVRRGSHGNSGTTINYSDFVRFLKEPDPLAAIRQHFEGLTLDLETVDISHLPAAEPGTED